MYYDKIDLFLFGITVSTSVAIVLCLSGWFRYVWGKKHPKKWDNGGEE